MLFQTIIQHTQQADLHIDAKSELGTFLTGDLLLVIDSFGC